MSNADASETETADYCGYHVRLGWLLVAVFGTLGLILESLHGIKWQGYVGVDFSTRREMWTLAHAHGTLLAIAHIAFGLSLPRLTGLNGRYRRCASWFLVVASLAMPVGFFLGGLQFYEGDPGLGILLVPVGATCLIVCAAIAALVHRTGAATRPKSKQR